MSGEDAPAKSEPISALNVKNDKQLTADEINQLLAKNALDAASKGAFQNTSYEDQANSLVANKGNEQQQWQHFLRQLLNPSEAQYNKDYQDFLSINQSGINQQYQQAANERLSSMAARHISGGFAEQAKQDIRQSQNTAMAGAELNARGQANQKVMDRFQQGIAQLQQDADEETKKKLIELQQRALDQSNAEQWGEANKNSFTKIGDWFSSLGKSMGF